MTHKFCGLIFVWIKNYNNYKESLQKLVEVALLKEYHMIGWKMINLWYSEQIISRQKHFSKLILSV